MTSAAATMRPKTEAEHAFNNMGLLRVVLALLVIVAHSFELTGGRSTELLVRAFGTLTFGEFAVDGFFLLSGFLITKSYQHSSSYLAYLRRRILRIYPGFVVAYSLCLLIVVPLSGAPPIAWTIRQCVKQVFRMLVLDPPSIDGAFPGLLVPQINLSMWTISYEFRCFCNGPSVVKLKVYPTAGFVLLSVVGSRPPLHAVRGSGGAIYRA